MINPLLDRVRKNAEVSPDRSLITSEIRIRRDAPRIGSGDVVQELSSSRQASQDFDTEAFAKDYTARHEAISKHDLETTPRDTVLKLLINRKLDEHFLFRVQKGEGENYCQAMRQVLSRSRARALKKKLPLDEFKLLTVGIVQQAEFDEVTLVRTKTLSVHEESVYDDIVAAFAKQEERK